MSDAAVARARACLGVRFRPQGRATAHGLDCVGVVMVAWNLPAVAVRGDYRLRAQGFGEIERELAMFFRAVPVTDAAAGDVLLVDAGREQPHLLIMTPEGYLHADLGAGRVVEVPGAIAWPVRSAWRHANCNADDLYHSSSTEAEERS